jgi:hypothetical protein
LAKAAECRQAAVTALDAAANKQYLSMATEWDELAKSLVERRAEERSVHHIPSLMSPAHKSRQH